MLTEVYGLEPYQSRTGGSIPVCEIFLDTPGVYTVGFAFGLRDEQVHAPDEFFRLGSFRCGQRAYARLLHELGRDL